MKKLRASITLSIIIFTTVFFMFCICAIDAGYIVNTRYKAQKITETTALYMVSILNSKPVEERNTAALNDIKERLESLYSNLGSSWGFKISEIEIKDESGHPKIKISTETYVPALFLRFTGIGIAKIMQTSYAASKEITMQQVSSDSDSYTFKTKGIITDKNGNDIKVNYDGNYFIFAGLEDSDKNIHWADISSMTTSEKTPYTLSNDLLTLETNAIIEKGDSFFDFSSDESKSIGLAKYIKIYKAPKTTPPAEGTAAETPTEGAAETPAEEPETAPAGEETTEEEPETVSPPVVTVLNQVKLIKASEF